VPGRLDFILQARLRGRPAIVGGALLGALAVSVLLFLLLGNGKVQRVLFFPDTRGSRLVAEQRTLPRHRGLEAEARELVEGVLLGPLRPDLARAFPRGVTVQSLLVRNRVLFVDISASAALPDAEVPLAAGEALQALARSIRANFPRVREVQATIGGQVPAARAEPAEEKKKI
jgi:hypothetical protein